MKMVYYVRGTKKGREEGKENAVNRKIDCVVSTETTEWEQFGMSPIATIGSSDIYYCINKKRPDLKLELDDAMRRMENDKPFYADELYKKYLSSVSNPVLSSEEKKYLSKHGKILIGYLKSDIGFSAVTDKCEKPVGVINDYVAFAKDCLGKNALSFQLVGFDSQEEQLQALKEKKIDMIFHVSQNPYAAEKDGIILSNTVINAPLAAVTAKNSFNQNEKNSVAVEKGNLSLKWHISYYYPEWNIIECDSTKDAEAKVAKIRAENANAAKSNFLFHMSHDIRTPMNALLGYSQLIKKEFPLLMKLMSRKHIFCVMLQKFKKF